MVKQITPVRRVTTRTLPAPRGKGTGRGAWVFIPEGSDISSVLGASLKGKKGAGKGAGQKGGGKQAVAKKPVSKYSEKLRSIDPSLKVWIGGLPEKTGWKDVEKHFAVVAKPTVTDIMKNGTAVVAYDSVEDVEAAVATLNGTDLNGTVIEVDVWVQKPKTERKEAKEMKAAPVQKTIKKLLPLPKQRAQGGKAAKGAGKGGKSGKSTPADDKMKEKLAAFQASQKVWVGGLVEGTSWKELEAHLSTVAKPTLTHIYRSTGVAVYESEDDVLTVITALDGSDLKGNTLQFDHWTMPEKKGKKIVKAKEEIE